jgi:plasmid stabilization system protein ParE
VTWRVVVDPLVRTDCRLIAAHYRAEAPEQVPRFWREFRAVKMRLEDNPLLAERHSMGLRRTATRVFPYNVFYDVDEERHRVTIVGVVHFRRDPHLIERRAAHGPA